MYDNNLNNGSDPYTNLGYYQPAQTAPAQPASQMPAQGNVSGGLKKAGKIFTKIGMCVGLGLCFGLCAGVGVYVVGESTGVWDKLNAPATVYETEDGYGEGELAELVKKVLVEDPDLKSYYGINEAKVVNTGSVVAANSDVSNVVEEVMPAMVSIVNHYVDRVYYFGQMIEQEQSGGGSGIIVGQNDEEILIATNYHVVQDAKSLNVYFINDAEADAVVKGVDPDMDLAVIAVRLDSIKPGTRLAISVAKLGDSDSLKLGESVIAIGNALGYGQSVTGGWISALNRKVQMEDGSSGTFIQTDAAINPGNSGGALLNMKGEVIGINSSKIGGALIDGIGYAIPITAAQPILEDLMSKETRLKVTDGNIGYLGIVPNSVTEDAATLYGMPQGVFVSQVDEGTPAAEAGMLRGDIIVMIDEKKLLTADDLRDCLTYYRPGEVVEVTLMRNQDGRYKEMVLSVTLGERPDK